MKTWKFSVLFFFLAWPVILNAQQISDIRIDKGRVSALEFTDTLVDVNLPLVEFSVNNTVFTSDQPHPLLISIEEIKKSDKGLVVTIQFKNQSRDTLILHNVLPFGRKNKVIWITGKGNHPLSRTHLFRPECEPVNVIVPDNAWNLGYCAFRVDSTRYMFGLSRRDPASFVNAVRKRFETVLHPGGSVRYVIYADCYAGDWQDGLTEVFQNRHLYDLDDFDDSLYKRDDLAWIRKSYVMHLMMAWDKDYYDGATQQFNWNNFQRKAKKLYGSNDVICLWPTWPTLGLDQRNQFDLYRDLPGGLPKLRELADSLRSKGTWFFIAYNPWDESTRIEGHLSGLASLIKETSADGVVLDTKGESSKELQETADQVKKGVIMYSEGMAVPKDMPGIISGRVHNALYYPPMLNLNKLIRPDFAIFRVVEVYKEPILREYALAFFNGYGTEINQFAPGHPEWEDDQYLFLGRTTRILRENHSNFISFQWKPLIRSEQANIWINEWPGKDKMIYTIFSLQPEGFAGTLFQVREQTGYHFIDLWNHDSVAVMKKEGRYFVNLSIDSFHKKWLGTNNEGAVGCVAQFPTLLKAELTNNYLNLAIEDGDEIRLWKGNPEYGKDYISLPKGNHQLFIPDYFERYEGKVVIQAFENDELTDEQIVWLKPGIPRLVSNLSPPGSHGSVKGMVKIPAGKFTFKTTQGDEFIPYPKRDEGKTFEMKSFWMDKHPVTNDEFLVFINSTGYQPVDTTRFLMHWEDGKPKKGEERFPVTYVSYEDAQAYSVWSGKRLPSEIEWQYAAQTGKLNEWPWNQIKPVTRTEQVVTETLTVKKIEGIDPVYCNLGDGSLYPVGKYKKGMNPFGLLDLTGCVWQLTNDVYESGSYRYIILKGGSYFKPSSSWWYVQGGPRELHYRQVLLRVSQGFERNATVGFRCVKD